MKGTECNAKIIFANFVRELNKYAAGVHRLNDSAGSYLIEYAEKKLNFNFPERYRQFLGLWNGGTLFGSGVMVFGIDEKKQDKRESRIPAKARSTASGEKKKSITKTEDIIDSNLPRDRWPGIPETYLIIARTGIGDRICLDMRTSKGGEAEVIQWDHEIQKKVRSWKTLAKWLEYEMKVGKELFDYDGNVL